jgi:hypothetical protein
MREIQKELKWHKQEKRYAWICVFSLDSTLNGSNISISQLYTLYCLRQVDKKDQDHKWHLHLLTL